MELIEQFRQKMLSVEPVNLFEYKEVFSHFKLLEDTIQDKIWHQEGNVLIHTNMVLEKAYEICKSSNLSFEQQKNIYFGCLLHDFGKPFTTFTKDNGKVVAYNHEPVGVPYAREFLKKYFPEFGYARREHILTLVEFHMMPKRLIKDEANDLAFKKLSYQTDTQELYLLEVADFMGRTGSDNTESLGYLHSFANKCNELGILGKHYDIPNTSELSNHQYSLVRWNILFKGMNESDNINKMKLLTTQTPCELKILIGTPGSGKSTYCKNIFPNVNVISLDEIRKELTGDITDQSQNDLVFSTGIKRLHNILKNRQSVIWDATSVSRKIRKLLIDTARKYGAFVSMVHFDLPLEVCLERNYKRDRVVPEDIIKKFYHNMQSPLPYEYDSLKVVDELTKFNV